MTQGLQGVGTIGVITLKNRTLLNCPHVDL